MNCWSLQLAGLGIDLNIYMLVRSTDPSGPRYADHPPFLRRGQLVLKYFRYSRVLKYSLRYSDEYLTRKLLVSGSPTCRSS